MMEQQQQICDNSSEEPTLTAVTEAAEEGDTMKNLCVICGVNMGECNPRQLCGKTRCYEEEGDTPIATFNEPSSSRIEIEDDLGEPMEIDDDLGVPMEIDDDLGVPMEIDDNLGNHYMLEVNNGKYHAKR